MKAISYKKWLVETVSIARLLRHSGSSRCQIRENSLYMVNM